MSFLSSVCSRNFQLTVLKSPSRLAASALTAMASSLTMSQILVKASSSSLISREGSCFRGTTLVVSTVGEGGGDFGK